MGITASGIEQKRFGGAVRGYDKSEVQAYLTEVAHHLTTLQQRVAIAEASAARAKEELDSLNDVLEAKLSETRDARRTIIEEAQARAAEIMATAQTGDAPTTEAAGTAEAIIAEAEAKANIRMREVEAALETANVRAQSILADAEAEAELRNAEADRVLESARRQARHINAEVSRKRADLEALNDDGAHDVVIDLTEGVPAEDSPNA